ncbi:MAG: hypothetical protein E7510_12550 [Ruminococcus sp.]|nr:hypothetical protein [Ruminococcus sp.]
MDEILKTLNDVITIMNERFDTMDKSITEVKTDVRNIKLHLENVTDKNIGLLAENVSSANDRLITIEKDVTALKDNQEIADVLIKLGTAFKR